MSDHAYVVESPISGVNVRQGTARVYVDTEERAKEIASAHPERTYRSIPLDEMPVKARENLLQARETEGR